MQDENSTSKQLKLNKCLENVETKNRLLQFFEVLVKIDDRERVVKSSNSNIKNSEKINND